MFGLFNRKSIKKFHLYSEQNATCQPAEDAAGTINRALKAGLQSVNMDLATRDLVSVEFANVRIFRNLDSNSYGVTLTVKGEHRR